MRPCKSHPFLSDGEIQKLFDKAHYVSLDYVVGPTSDELGDSTGPVPSCTP